MWNAHQVTLHGKQRRSNLCKAWNCPIEHLMGFSILKVDSAQVSTALLNASCGEFPCRCVKHVYMRLQLHQLCVDRSEGVKTIEVFLLGAGHNIRWKPHTNQVNMNE